MAPTRTSRIEDGRNLPLLFWRFAEPARAICSGPLGGGVGDRQWIINATVSREYSRMDPDRHLAELADGLGLRGPGAGLLTAVDVGAVEFANDGGVEVAATVGLGHPTWAAAPDGDLRHGIGTINIVGWVPVALTDAALVNAALTVTEAKVQALWEYGLEATGTASDAVVVACPAAGPAEPFGGPRSTWGARLARATHQAVLAGTAAWPPAWGHPFE
ncbi:adenosylcobinamide amidohydrolase [Luedemannella helvata]|uniref:Adenosylcobinamide amidohydrolase n=1 Tax=Luedemannella helvata TaxID=349315 RepID=A0ABN2KDW1_9ACTN